RSIEKPLTAPHARASRASRNRRTGRWPSQLDEIGIERRTAPSRMKADKTIPFPGCVTLGCSPTSSSFPNYTS
ncbi:MAG: hypothetical protein J2P31_17945, partial [Blastocatellia bacterium]|nr:hypothetical protein [Blastocatellia bacterium]